MSQKNKIIEFASKSSHSYIINDNSVQELLNNCILPDSVKDINFDARCETVIKNGV